MKTWTTIGHIGRAAVLVLFAGNMFAGTPLDANWSYGAFFLSCAVTEVLDALD